MFIINSPWLTNFKIFGNMNKRILRKIKTLRLMIQMYCKKHHHLHHHLHHYRTKLCPECEETIKYALDKSQKCPYKEKASVCETCKIHCYHNEKQEKIKKIMRFSGPKMIFHHPILTIWHLLDKKFASTTSNRNYD